MRLGCVWLRVSELLNLALKLPRNPVALHVISDLDAAVPKLVTHVSHVMTPEQPDRGVGVPEIVNPDMSKACQFQALVQALFENFPVKHLPFSIVEDPLRGRAALLQRFLLWVQSQSPQCFHQV